MLEAKPKPAVKTVIVLSVFLSLCGVGVPGLRLITSAHASQNGSSVSAKPILDDDGDDMRYHWQNPAYAAEQMLQIGGIAIMLTTIGIAEAIKRYRREAHR